MKETRQPSPGRVTSSQIEFPATKHHPLPRSPPAAQCLPCIVSMIQPPLGSLAGNRSKEDRAPQTIFLPLERLLPEVAMRHLTVSPSRAQKGSKTITVKGQGSRYQTFVKCRRMVPSTCFRIACSKEGMQLRV